MIYTSIVNKLYSNVWARMTDSLNKESNWFVNMNGLDIALRLLCIPFNLSILEEFMRDIVWGQSQYELINVMVNIVKSWRRSKSINRRSSCFWTVPSTPTPNRIAFHKASKHIGMVLRSHRLTRHIFHPSINFLYEYFVSETKLITAHIHPNLWQSIDSDKRTAVEPLYPASISPVYTKRNVCDEINTKRIRRIFMRCRCCTLQLILNPLKFSLKLNRVYFRPLCLMSFMAKPDGIIGSLSTGTISWSFDGCQDRKIVLHVCHWNAVLPIRLLYQPYQIWILSDHFCII